MRVMTQPSYQPEIVHGVPGRLRIRVPSLHISPELKASLETRVKATPAVETVRISAPTDCIIINYHYQEPLQENIYQLICQITEEFFAPVNDVNHQGLINNVTPPENSPAPPKPEVSSESVFTPAADAPSLAELAPTATQDLDPAPPIADSTPESPPVDLAPEPTVSEPEAPVVADAPPKPSTRRTRTRPTPRKPRTRKKPDPPASSS